MRARSCQACRLRYQNRENWSFIDAFNGSISQDRAIRLFGLQLYRKCPSVTFAWRGSHALRLARTV